MGGNHELHDEELRYRTNAWRTFFKSHIQAHWGFGMIGMSKYFGSRDGKEETKRIRTHQRTVIIIIDGDTRKKDDENFWARLHL